MIEKPCNINFSSGPCAKRKGWSFPGTEFLGISHRAADSVKFIQNAISLQKDILQIPPDYHLGIVSASATGAMEMLLWNLLGNNAVDVLAHCVFGQHWARDIQNELRIQDVNVFSADFPNISDYSQVSGAHDIVFCWVSTTSGTSVQNANWIPSDRTGLTICDVTSAAFTSNIDWLKIDAAAFSWQKGLGGESGLGSIILSPRAIHRLQTYTPSWPIPRIFRMKDSAISNSNNGANAVNLSIFDGYTINTPSMLCIEEFCNNLLWAKSLGGLPSILQRVEDNYCVFKSFIDKSKIFDFLCHEKDRAHCLGCIKITAPFFINLSESEQWNFLRLLHSHCVKNAIGRDFIGHSLTKPHIRIWMGPTIETQDLRSFLYWLEIAFQEIANSIF